MSCLPHMINYFLVIKYRILFPCKIVIDITHDETYIAFTAERQMFTQYFYDLVAHIRLHSQEVGFLVPQSIDYFLEQCTLLFSFKKKKCIWNNKINIVNAN